MLGQRGGRMKERPSTWARVAETAGPEGPVSLRKEGVISSPEPDLESGGQRGRALHF